MPLKSLDLWSQAFFRKELGHDKTRMLFMSHISLLIFMVFFVSCSLQTRRSYLAEMEHDDSRFFNPQEDFPIVAGDTGRDWISERERKNRTPAATEDMFDDLVSKSMKAELRSLEESQEDESLRLYNKYKHKLGTLSERIYYLKLPDYERKDYLIAKGLIKIEPEGISEAQKTLAIQNHKIFLGMKKADVIASLGKPTRVDIAGNASYENERWLYHRDSATKYIYFEAGEVQGWE